MKFQSGPMPVRTKSIFNPSPYQQAVAEWTNTHRHGHEAAVIKAVAGSGKSKTLSWVYELESTHYDRMLLLCFNSQPAKEAREKNLAGANIRNVQIITYHSFGNSAIKKLYHPKLDEQGTKTEIILKNKLASNMKFLLPPIKKLVSICKNNGEAQPSDMQLNDACMTFDIEFGENVQQDTIFKAYDLVRYALSESVNTIDTLIDFDDMIFLPVVMGLQPDQYDLILADEFQDTNRAQSALIQLGRTGLMIGVGDPWQSIYAFRGADSMAMQKLVADFNADELPLSISYRCPMSVGDLVRKEFPHIGFESPEWAIPGSVSDMDIAKSLDGMQDGDLIVSRVNAALPPIAFALIRKGKTARIMGRDIGKALAALITKQNAYDLPDLFHKLYDFRDKQMQKYMNAQRPDKIQQLDDQIETINALSEDANSVWDIITRCNTMFSDDRVGIQLGTVHKNKGREAKNVYIARPDLLPLPFVMEKGSAEAKQQEENAVYVSYTRAMDNLIFLRGEL